MPCIRPIVHRQRRFLPHFPPGSMRCRFSLELVSPLPHTMRNVFPKSETRPIDGSSISPPSSSLLKKTVSFSPLIPKPRGEVSRVSCGGYTLKNVLEQQHGWEEGLYHKIREKLCSLADEYLDTSLAYSTQVTKAERTLTLICELVSREFPILLKFEDNWVTHDYLRIYLKNSAQKAKKEQHRDNDLTTAAKGKGRAN